MASGKLAEWIAGMARVENGFVVILDIDKTLALDALLSMKDQTMYQAGEQIFGETQQSGI
jgi:hypothetical protein